MCALTKDEIFSTNASLERAFHIVILILISILFLFVCDMIYITYMI